MATTTDLAAAAERLAAAVASATWTGATWTHEAQDEKGQLSGSDGSPIYCEGGSADCAYCARATESAASARARGLRAVEALRSGDAQGAAFHLALARGIEAGWGDDTCWSAISADYTEILEAVKAPILEAPIKVGSKVHAWDCAYTPDYDEGRVYEIDGVRAKVTWQSLSDSECSIGDLRLGHPGLWPARDEEGMAAWPDDENSSEPRGL